MPPWSSDAWAFKRGATHFGENISIELGRLHCEQQFLSRLHRAGFKIFNVGIGGFIRCIHVHETALRYTANIVQEDIDNDSKWELRLPYNGEHKWVDEYTLKPNTYITGSNASWHATNFYYDNRHTNGFGSYFVRDIKTLF